MSVASIANPRALAGSVLILASFLGSCATAEDPAPEKDFARPLPEGAPALERVTDPALLPDFRPAFADRERALEALDESLAYFAKPSSRQWFPYQTADRSISHEEQVTTLEALRSALVKSSSPDEFHGRCLLSFDVYRSVGWDGSGEVLYTAYCEPIFKGSRLRDGPFQHPLYGLPDDLVKAEDGTPLGRRTAEGTTVPYYTRREIEDRGLMEGREIVWLRDPFEVYVAHVQGSARVDLPTGERICVGYAGKTDRPYSSIGRFLIEEGTLRDQDLSLTSLKAYFRTHPDEVKRVLSVNESYVFFTEREPGPFGSIGAKVIPYHSVATDKAVFPRGGPVIVTSRLPTLTPTGRIAGREETLLAFDQDTGGAIRSAGRADLFVGTGPEAERLAGHTRSVGRLLYLFVKPPRAPRP